MTDPRETLARIRSLADAATEGPWAWAERPTASGDEWAVFSPTDWALATNRDGRGADAEFIAHARTDVPALVAALRAVLELHAPTPSDIYPHDVCHHPHCTDPTDQMEQSPWPCPTVTAITTALEATR